jgi:hypothetical protein
MGPRDMCAILNLDITIATLSYVEEYISDLICHRAPSNSVANLCGTQRGRCTPGGRLPAEELNNITGCLSGWPATDLCKGAMTDQRNRDVFSVRHHADLKQ